MLYKSINFPHSGVNQADTSTALQSGRLFLCTITTLCLYHIWSHTQHLCTGRFPTSWWKFFIKSSMDTCLFLNDFFRSVSCICSHILLTESFRTLFLLFVSHCCSFCLFLVSSLANCMLFLLNSRSLSLYAVFFLCHLLAHSVTYALTIPVCYVFPSHLLAGSITYALTLLIFLVFPSHLLALCFTFSLAVPVCWVFPSHLYALSVTFPLSILVRCISPCHVHTCSGVLSFIFTEFWLWSGSPFPFYDILLPLVFVFKLNRTSIKYFTACLLNTVISIYIFFSYMTYVY